MTTFDRNTDRYAHPSGNGGEGSDWRDGYVGDPCSCTLDECLDSCDTQGCRGYTIELRQASGINFDFDPDTCPKVV